MKLADYRSDDGETIELDFTGREFPKTVEQNGKVYHRVFCGASISIPDTFKAGSNASEFRYKKPPLDSDLPFK